MKTITLNKINGGDSISDSMLSINSNFEMIENAIDTYVSNGDGGINISGFEWKSGKREGPGATITLTNGNKYTVGKMPSASTESSGVVTTGEQRFSGKKVFVGGVGADRITNIGNREIFKSEGNTMTIGGEGGIKFTYNENGSIRDVSCRFFEKNNTNNASYYQGDSDGIESFRTAFAEVLAEAESLVQVFPEREVPKNYNYGDVWMFGGADEVYDSINQNTLEGLEKGSIYYCKEPADDIDGFSHFNKGHWEKFKIRPHMVDDIDGTEDISEGEIVKSKNFGTMLSELLYGIVNNQSPQHHLNDVIGYLNEYDIVFVKREDTEQD